MQEFTATVKRRGRLAVVTITGELDISTLPQLREALAQAEEDGEVAGLVIDLSNTQFADSSGMNALLGAHKRASAADRAFGVVAPPPGGGVERVMQLLGFDDIFALYDSLDSADAALQPHGS